jgi:D-serine deaminase-like pyridoxal phosphate-dependent protein
MTAADDNPTPPTPHLPQPLPKRAPGRAERERRRPPGSTGEPGAQRPADGRRDQPAEGPRLETPAPAPPPNPREAYERYEEAFSGLQAPFAFVDLDAVWANAADMLRRAAGKPIRVASKSVRCRRLLERVLDLDPGFQGLLTFTLAETLWLWEQGMRDLVLAYPTADRASLVRLARLTAEHPDEAPVVMVDSPEHLELIESAASSFVAPVRVAIELDVSWWPLRGFVKVGPKRSPIRRASQAVRLAHEVERRRHTKLVGLMAYEGQIAGVGDSVPGKLIRNALIRGMQAASARDVADRRAEMVAAVQDVSELEFVNGGGTGSIELTAEEGAVTEIAAGSGFYAPILFDHYRAFRLRPAAMFALPIVRRPGGGVATALGGGYLASGVGARDRMPLPHLPAGLRLDPFEGTGEVQTPLRGRATEQLELGDRVYFRHVKAGELCERFNRLHLLAGDTIVEEAPTYRGEGKAFL